MKFLTRTEPKPQERDAANAARKRIFLKFSDSGAGITAVAAAPPQGGELDSPREPEIGDKMPDGTVYAGVSPNTGKPMYATAATAPLQMTFAQAADYASGLDAHGHQDWRVPTKDELGVLFNHRAAIGGFKVGSLYWSATSNGEWTASVRQFTDGSQEYSYKDSPAAVRCVR